MEILGFDIERALVPDVSLVEIFVRGTVIYLIIFFLLRVVLRRKSGNVAFTDLLVLVLIADAAQNAMAAEYHSLTAGLALVGTLVFWSYALDWLGFRFSRFQWYVYPPKKALITEGRLVQSALREELITIEELMTQLRLNGAEKVEEVRAAYIEGNGQVSVLKRDGGGDSSKPSQAASVGGGG